MDPGDERRAEAVTKSADEDNRRWLEATLRRAGWIRRKTHGEQAQQALNLIMLHNIGYLRLAATVQAAMRRLAVAQAGDPAAALPR